MWLLPINFLPVRSWTEDLFWCDLQKSLHLFFCKRWVPFFEVKQRWAQFLPRFSAIWPRYLGILHVILRILPKFSGILPGFSTNQNLWGCACTPVPPPPTPLVKKETHTWRQWWVTTWQTVFFLTTNKDFSNNVFQHKIYSKQCLRC